MKMVLHKGVAFLFKAYLVCGKSNEIASNMACEIGLQMNN